MATPISRRSSRAKLRSCRISPGSRSILEDGLDIAGEGARLSGFAILFSLGMEVFQSSVQLSSVDVILLQGVINRFDFDRSQGNHTISVKNADIFALGGALQPLGKIRSGLGGR
jgi:hypothetical protein